MEMTNMIKLLTLIGSQLLLVSARLESQDAISISRSSVKDDYQNVINIASRKKRYHAFNGKIRMIGEEHNSETGNERFKTTGQFSVSQSEMMIRRVRRNNQYYPSEGDERVQIRTYKGTDGRVKTTVEYYNRRKGSEKFTINGEFPVPQSEMLAWVLQNKHLYNPSPIPYQDPKPLYPAHVKTLTTTLNGVPTKTEISYFNQGTGSFKITLNGGAPAVDDLILWVESNKQNYMLQPIPYEPHKPTQPSNNQPNNVIPPPPNSFPSNEIYFENKPSNPPQNNNYHPQNVNNNGFTNTNISPQNVNQPNFNHPPTDNSMYIKPQELYGSSFSWDINAPFCGKVTTYKVAFGKDTSIEETPWQVSLFDAREQKLLCGGSIVTARHVVTAAHCFKEDLTAANYLISAGSDNLQELNPWLEIHTIYRNKWYNVRTRKNDIAVVFMRTEFSFSATISPICLPPHDMVYKEGTRCLVGGFGGTEQGESTNKRLKTAEIVIRNKQNCMKEYGGLVNITEGMLCAQGGPTGDACRGDSGGPLACPLNGTYHLLGVTSFGRDCSPSEQSTPGVYVYVSKYVNLIINRIQRSKSERA